MINTCVMYTVDLYLYFKSYFWQYECKYFATINKNNTTHNKNTHFGGFECNCL